MLNMLLSASSFITSVLYIALAIVVLLFMILIHELGHYTAGKLLKFKINEFSIGFGKALYKKTKKNGEVFAIRIFPLGGYCAFEGEDDDKPQTAGAFNNQKPWKRLIVLFMGAFFNFLSALVFSAILLMSYGFNDRVQINDVIVPSYVTEASDWLMKDDIVYAVNGKETNFIYDEYFTNLIAKYGPEEAFIVSVYRNGESKDLTIRKNWIEVDYEESETYGKLYDLDNSGEYKYYVKLDSATGKYKVYNSKTPKGVTNTVDEETHLVTIKFGYAENQVSQTYKMLIDGEGNLSLTTSRVGVTTKNYVYGFFEALGKTFEFCFGWAWKILLSLFQMVTGKVSVSEMGGTITTVKLMASSSQANIANLVLLIPVISINLAVFNLLPFPALDGARMVFVLIEWIRKKPINRKVEGTIHFAGLIILFAFVIVMDILQLFVFKRF